MADGTLQMIEINIKRTTYVYNSGNRDQIREYLKTGVLVVITYSHPRYRWEK